MKQQKPIPDQLLMFPEKGNIETNTQLVSKECQYTDVEKSRPRETVTKLGDLWQIGKHRLLCGNSADYDDFQKLMAGEKVQVVHTDPPYNVCVQPQSKDKGSAKSRKLEGDFISDAKFGQLLYMWFTHIRYALEPGRAFYIWGGYSNFFNYPTNIKSVGLFFHQVIVWVKSISVFTRKDFMGKHEWCFYGWKPGAPHKYCGPNNITDVWEIPNVPRQKMIHLTEKPVEIPAQAIKCSSEPGEKVLDLFGGSGSTLVAAHELDRICYLMELDPWYCDLIVERCKELGLSAQRRSANVRSG